MSGQHGCGAKAGLRREVVQVGVVMGTEAALEKIKALIQQQKGEFIIYIEFEKGDNDGEGE